MKDEISRIHDSISEKGTNELANCLPDEIPDVFGRSEEIRQVTEAIQFQ